MRPGGTVPEDLIARLQLVEIVKWRAVGGAVAGDGRVAGLAGERRVGVVTGTLLEVGAQSYPLDYGPVDIDLGNANDPDRFALIGRRLQGEEDPGAGLEIGRRCSASVPASLVDLDDLSGLGVEYGPPGLGRRQARFELLLEPGLGPLGKKVGDEQLVKHEAQDEEADIDERPTDAANHFDYSAFAPRPTQLGNNRLRRVVGGQIGSGSLGH